MSEVSDIISELLGEMETKKQNHLAKNTADLPEVGMFWYVDGAFMSESKPAKDCIIPGANKIQYPISHQDQWESYVRRYPKQLGPYHRRGRSLMDDYNSFTYPPRGRVTGILKSDGSIEYVLLISPVLNTTELIETVKKEYNLDKITVYPDKTHYNTEFVGDTKKDFEGKLGAKK